MRHISLRASLRPAPGCRLHSGRTISSHGLQCKARYPSCIAPHPGIKEPRHLRRDHKARPPDVIYPLSRPCTMSLPAISCVYFGMAGAFSRPPLEALLRAGVAVSAVALPALPGASVTNLDAPFAVLPRPASAAGRRALPLLTPARDTDTDADTILQ